MKKSIIITVLLAISLLISGIIFAETGSKVDSQIGYVNMQKLFENHPQKKASEDELQGKAKELQQKLQTEAEGLDQQERQKLLQKYQQQLSDLEEELVQEVMEEVNRTIREVAEEKGITVVLDKSVVLSGGYDLTDEVLEAVKEKANTAGTPQESENK